VLADAPDGVVADDDLPCRLGPLQRRGQILAIQMNKRYELTSRNDRHTVNLSMNNFVLIDR
jgi:hypothetical protein